MWPGSWASTRCTASSCRRTRWKKVEELLEKKPERDKLAFVGDGINDAPVLSRADIGIAMGALGSDAAIEAADVVLMDDDPLKIATAIRISRKCLGIVCQNIVFAIGVKLLCLVLVALGLANMWLAIFADVGVMVLAVLNAIRALFVKKPVTALSAQTIRHNGQEGEDTPVACPPPLGRQRLNPAFRNIKHVQEERRSRRFAAK